jgi:hypothetical protein
LAVTFVGCAYVLDAHCHVCNAEALASLLMPGMLMWAARFGATGELAMDQNGN